jgi:hypothetical protein
MRKPRPKKQPLHVEVVYAPRDDSEQRWNAALDIIADAFAERILEKSRAEAAAEMGLTPAEVDLEPRRVAQIARAHGDSLVGEDKTTKR